MDQQNQTPEYQAAYDAGAKQVIATKMGDTPIFIVPEGMKVEALDAWAEERRERPLSLQQTVKVLSAQSFLDYYNRFATETSTVFVDTEDGKFTAVLDYHDSPAEPAHKHHLVVYACPKSKEWSVWLSNNNNKMEQEDFALFIEDNLKEIIEPNGAEMLEIASSLKAKKGVDFKSGIRLDNGETQFTYSETINGQAGTTGQFSVPDKFTLSLRPFHGGAPYKVEARFRYRITQNGLILWYTLIRPHAVHEDATAEVLKIIRDGMSKGHLIEADSF
ncbi:YfdQ family protein [Gilvimarinus agarilyticus]|uniref:YfdQ family protein n=1 Tax=Gilvimarinus agarilyticus TaxID=679259 RepID=UPI000696998A|nr:DUF2303 family protein [Gilvimarinus agarilyticus]